MLYASNVLDNHDLCRSIELSIVIQGHAMTEPPSADRLPVMPQYASCGAPCEPQLAGDACTHTLEHASRLAGGAVAGQYLLTSFTEQRTRYGSPFLKCLLEDSTGQMAAYVWEKSGLIDQVRSFSTPMPVQATFSTRELNGRTIGDLQAIFAIDEAEVANAAHLLPRSVCPEHACSALHSLTEAVAKIASPTLRRFINRVLLDARIGRPLLACRASQAHHHADQGGLLVHSVEVMEICTSAACNRMSVLELDITRIAALLHDIGKIRAVGSGRVRPIHCKLVRHETQSGRLLEPHLEWLRGRDPDSAAALDYIFDFIAQPSATRGYARFVGAELVVYADKLSTAFSNRRRLSDLLEQTMPHGPTGVSQVRRIKSVEA